MSRDSGFPLMVFPNPDAFGMHGPQKRPAADNGALIVFDDKHLRRFWQELPHVYEARVVLLEPGPFLTRQNAMRHLPITVQFVPLYQPSTLFAPPPAIVLPQTAVFESLIAAVMPMTGPAGRLAKTTLPVCWLMICSNVV